LAPGAFVALADSDAVDSDAHQGDVAVAFVDFAEGDDGVLAAARVEGVSVVDVNKTSNHLTLSIEWKSVAQESDVINACLDNGCVSPSVLQCVAVCCIVLHCVALCCIVLYCVALCCSVLQCVAACCSVLQRVEVRGSLFVHGLSVFMHQKV